MKKVIYYVLLTISIISHHNISVFERGVWLCSDSENGDPEKRLRLVLGYKASYREMVNVLKDCPPDIKAMNLRAIMNYLTSMAVYEPALQREILKISGHPIISLLGEGNCGLPEGAILRAKATIMKIQEDTKLPTSSKLIEKKEQAQLSND